MIRPLLLTLSLAAAPASAQLCFQDTGAIDVAVVAFTGHPIGTEGGARTVVDPRLKLAACPLPQLDWRGPLHDAVVVTCDAPRWRIFVPVKRAPGPGPTAASPATASTLAAPTAPVIRRGDAITLEVGAAGFSVTREGVAMGDAPAGGRLSVRIDPARPPVQAVAIEGGKAALPGWSR